MRFPEVIGDLTAWAKSLKVQLDNLMAGVSSADDLMPDIGEIIYHPGPRLPNNFVECNGQILLKAAYPDLYKQIGDTFNFAFVPDTAFMLPNLIETTPEGVYPLMRAFGRRGTKVPIGPKGSFTTEPPADLLDYGLIIDAATETLDYGLIIDPAGTTLDYGASL